MAAGLALSPLDDPLVLDALLLCTEVTLSVFPTTEEEDLQLLEQLDDAECMCGWGVGGWWRWTEVDDDDGWHVIELVRLELGADSGVRGPGKMRLAIRFRVQKKRLLKEAIQRLKQRKACAHADLCKSSAEGGLTHAVLWLGGCGKPALGAAAREQLKGM
eukprot:2087457-Rhodomonas_salina.1